MSHRALVAGGAGFIGSHLCERLLVDGFDVVAVDNLLTGSPSNIAHLTVNPRFQHLEMDAENALDIDGRFDLVLHFASPASPPRYMTYWLETLHSGSSVTEALLRVAERDGARFILSSTSEVYGDPSVHPQTEDYWGNVNPTGPRSVYDEAKRYSEALSMTFRRERGVDTGIVRIFNTYGPRMDPDDGRAVPAFVSAALRDQPLPLYGDGSQTRSFCYIDDLIDGIVLLAASDQPGPINMGNPREQTVLEIAETIVRIVGSRSEIHTHPRPVDDPARRKPDIALARELLGWEPRIDAQEGLVTTIAWFRELTANAPTGRNT